MMNRDKQNGIRSTSLFGFALKFLQLLFILNAISNMALLVDSVPEYEIGLFKCTLEFRKNDITDNYSCSSQEINNYYYISGYGHVKKLVKKYNLRIVYEIIRKNEKTIKLFDAELDGCQFLEGKYIHPKITAIFQKFLSTAELPKRCPVQKGFVVRVTNFSLNTKEFPIVQKPMHFVFSVHFIVSGTKIGELTVLGKVYKPNAGLA